MTRPEWIEVGRVARPHGVRGEVRINVDSDNPERFIEGAMLYARPTAGGKSGVRSPERTKLRIDNVRGTSGSPIVAFADIDDREAAAGLRGWVLEIPVQELPELADDEFYPFELEGLEVREPDGPCVGRVSEVVDAPAHPLLSVRLDTGKEVLVPFVLAAVPEVAPSEGYLTVRREFLVEP